MIGRRRHGSSRSPGVRRRASPNSHWWPAAVLLDGLDITDVPTDFNLVQNLRLERSTMADQSSMTTTLAPKRPVLWYLTTAASIAVGIVPIWLLETRFGVPRKISVGYGILAYVIGSTALKLPLHHFLVERVLRSRLSTRVLAATHGAISGISELSVAAMFFVYVVPRLSWWQLVGFGVGAGACEAIMLPFISNPFKGTSLGEHADEVYRAAARSPAFQWLGVLERVWAMLVQTSTRGLIGLSVFSGNPVPACVAVAGFAVLDGVGYYWHLRKWRFDSLPLLTRVHLFIGIAACVLRRRFLCGPGTCLWLLDDLMRSVVQISESRPGHFASIRRLPN
jgi:hypothetical protein